MTTDLTTKMHSLLALAATQQRYAAAIAEATGEHFNVFRILGVHHREVTTHSPMLGALLNPRGVHGQREVFLKLFLTQFEIVDFDPNTAQVKLEHHMGAVTDNSGGRIDILIRDGLGASIVIENKIYAEDQPKQMTRNRNFDSKANLFYLTLDGRNPTDREVEGLRCISYELDILAWLKACRKEAACVPNVRETISQYIHLIEELTQQNTSALMNQELTHAILQSRESYQAFTALVHARTEVQRSILTDFNTTLKEVAADLGLELAQQLHKDGRRYDGWFFTSRELEAQNISISFEFENKGYQNCYFGFKLRDSKEACPVGPELQALFVSAFNRWPAQPSYVVHTSWSQYSRWSDETFESIRFGTFASDLKALTERLLTFFRQACGTPTYTSTIQTP